MCKTQCVSDKYYNYKYIKIKMKLINNKKFISLGFSFLERIVLNMNKENNGIFKEDIVIKNILKVFVQEKRIQDIAKV